MEPSQPFGDAPCPHCGCLLRFEPHRDGLRVSVAMAAKVAPQVPARSNYVCPGCKTQIPYGTQTNPPPDHCPTCLRGLSIPTRLEHVPGKPQFIAGHQGRTANRRGNRAVLAFWRLRAIQLTVIALYSAWFFFAKVDHKGVVLLSLVMFVSFAAGLLTIADTFRYHGGRFGLSTMLLVVMLFALSFCALGVLIHTPALFT